MVSLWPETWILLAIGQFMIVARVASRIYVVGIKKLALDDYLIVFAGFLFALECSLATFIGRHGGTNNMPPAERAALTEEQVHQRSIGSKLIYIGWFDYSLLLWVNKACMICFYRRLTLGTWQQKFLRYITWAVAISYVGIVITLFTACHPIQKNWQVRPSPGKECTEQWAFFGITGLPNLLTDMALLAVPLPLILKAKLPLSKKLQLLVLFSFGGFIILATIIRHAVVFQDIYNATQVVIWALRETCVSLIVNNAPMIKPAVSLLIRQCKGEPASLPTSRSYGSQTRGRKLHKSGVIELSDNPHTLTSSTSTWRQNLSAKVHGSKQDSQLHSKRIPSEDDLESRYHEDESKERIVVQHKVSYQVESVRTGTPAREIDEDWGRTSRAAAGGTFYRHEIGTGSVSTTHEP